MTRNDLSADDVSLISEALDNLAQRLDAELPDAASATAEDCAKAGKVMRLDALRIRLNEPRK